MEVTAYEIVDDLGPSQFKGPSLSKMNGANQNSWGFNKNQPSDIELQKVPDL